jgi:hypothetical protein
VTEALQRLGLPEERVDVADEGNRREQRVHRPPDQ